MHTYILLIVRMHTHTGWQPVCQPDGTISCLSIQPETTTMSGQRNTHSVISGYSLAKQNGWRSYNCQRKSARLWHSFGIKIHFDNISGAKLTFYFYNPRSAECTWCLVCQLMRRSLSLSWWLLWTLLSLKPCAVYFVWIVVFVLSCHLSHYVMCYLMKPMMFLQ